MHIVLNAGNSSVKDKTSSLVELPIYYDNCIKRAKPCRNLEAYWRATSTSQDPGQLHKGRDWHLGWGVREEQWGGVRKEKSSRTGRDADGLGHRNCTSKGALVHEETNSVQKRWNLKLEEGVRRQTQQWPIRMSCVSRVKVFEWHPKGKLPASRPGHPNNLHLPGWDHVTSHLSPTFLVWTTGK